ncbi:MAG TPA: hypothetical protein V6D47_07455, partial [Oscillatoriaceae cyanobacterium]
NKPVTRVQKIQQVKDLTQVFSLSKNTGLSTATSSFEDLAQALSSAFSGLAPLASLGGTMHVQSLDEALDTLRSAGLDGPYHVAGVTTQGATQITYDDSGQVTSVVGPNAELDISVASDGDTRTLTATIVRSPDGTTGAFTLSVTGNWHAKPTLYRPLQESDASSTAEATATPTPDATDNPTPTPTLDIRPTPTPDGTESWPPPQPSPTPAPYHWFPNETVTQVSAVTLSLDIKPKGSASNETKLTGTFDQPKAMLVQGVFPLTLPTHWKLALSVPKVAMTWESQLAITHQQLALDANGTMQVAAASGAQHYTYTLKLDQATRSGELDLVNTDAHVQLTVAGHQPQTGTPTVSTTLVSTDDGSKLGTVALDPEHPNVAEITFNDGTRQDWELYPASMVMFTPPPPQTRPAR